MSESGIVKMGGGGKNNAISFIRMIAMEMIIICHIMQYYDFVLAWWFNVGVQIFLCISGFLYGQKAIENIARFYNQRIKKDFGAILSDSNSVCYFRICFLFSRY